MFAGELDSGWPDEMREEASRERAQRNLREGAAACHRNTSRRRRGAVFRPIRPGAAETLRQMSA